MKLGIPGAAQRMEASAKMLIPLQRVGTPEDAAGAMLMLASPYASYISAQVRLHFCLVCIAVTLCINMSCEILVSGGFGFIWA